MEAAPWLLPSAPLRGACGRSSRPWLAYTQTSSVASPSGVRRTRKEISVATDSPRSTPITTTALGFTVMGGGKPDGVPTGVPNPPLLCLLLGECGDELAAEVGDIGDDAAPDRVENSRGASGHVSEDPPQVA